VAAPPKSTKFLPDINSAATQKLQIYVFGEGSAGELGLGTKSADGKKVVDVRRPRLNGKLEPLGIVQIAVGGMHCAVLTANNMIFTWGVNDQGALGRETTQEGKMVDVTADDQSGDNSGLNLSEAEPRVVDSKHFLEDTKFANLYAGDSTTFALTTTGLVYGWGTFRVSFLRLIYVFRSNFHRAMKVF
jgi:regulator of chromosome condensation